jgi:hypothetical protein
MSSRDRPNRDSPTPATVAQALAIIGGADGPSATARAKPSTKGRIQCLTRVHRTASTTSGMRMDTACSVIIGKTALQGIAWVHLDGNHGDHLAATAKGGLLRSILVGVAHLLGTARQLIAADVR